MPLYDCSCDDCGEVLEYRTPVDQRFVRCSACGGIAERTFPQRVHFKAWWQDFSSDCRDELRHDNAEGMATDLGRQYQGFGPGQATPP